MRSIAFMFMIYDKINHESLWKSFFDQDEKKRHNLYIHYKENSPLEFFESFKLSSTVPTKWGHISLVKAQGKLLEQALLDKDNQHFAIVSNSCAPVKKFQYIFDFLDPEKSYINASSDQEVFPRANAATSFLQNDKIKKSHAWCILNRKHAQIMLDRESDLVQWFENVEVPEEFCYRTLLNILDLNDEIVYTHSEPYEGTTFVQWTSDGLTNFSVASDETLQKLIDSRCLFARKFKPECDLGFLHRWHNNL
jgi:hypothetical protein